MRSDEHRSVGQAASGGALVQVGGLAEDGLTLSYGDVVALSGDFFAGQLARARCAEDIQAGPDDLTSNDLFRFAATPGDRGTRPGTWDEIICALKVMAVDGDFIDSRFEPGGEFGDFQFTATAAATEVERRVRDRFLALAAANGDHFVAPDGASDAHDNTPQSRRFGSAVVAYRRLHELALDQACWLGRCRGDESQAMAREAAAQHYLTDAFAAGHLRTPVTAIRHFWHGRYPRFWQNLQRKVAADTVAALRELVRQLAVAAARAGINDIEVAYRLGVSGSCLRGEVLYRAVRSATGAPYDSFRPETRIPTLSADNPPQNWWARDVETLWNSPIVGAAGTTVGMAVEETLRVGGEVFCRLDRLGPGVLEVPDILGVPALRQWTARKACQAYHHGFIQDLAQHPKATVVAIVGNETDPGTSVTTGRVRGPESAGRSASPCARG